MAATAPDSHDGTDAPRELPGSRRARPSAEHETGCPLELELTQFRAQVEAFAAAGVVSAWVDPRSCSWTGVPKLLLLSDLSCRCRYCQRKLPAERLGPLSP